MIPLTLAEVAQAVGGQAVGGRGHGEASITGAAFIDTRAPEPGGLFVAIRGERVDGHDFVDQAVAGGAVAVLGSQETAAPTVVVDDVVVALGRLARHVHDRLGARGGLTTYAMTGSQGKTGTKDFLAGALEHLVGVDHVIATSGNFNNEIGVPLTVLRATPETRHLVVEMGARGIGHIADLCRIAPPDVAAVLNVGTAHVGEFGSPANIALAKGEIVESLTATGTAVLNADDPLVAAMAGRTSARVLTWGIDSADLVVTDVEPDDHGRCRGTFEWHEERAAFELGEVGGHQTLNAAAAAAMALAAGFPLADVAAGISAARSRSRWRMELGERADGLLVVNDAYNANPESMSAAISALTTIAARSGRRSVAVLGEMYELGADEEEGHRRVGGAAAAAGVDVLVAVGPLARYTAQGYAESVRSGDTTPGEVIVTGSRDEAVEWVRHNVAAADVVLIKASRGAALEVLATALLDQTPPIDPSANEGSPTR